MEKQVCFDELNSKLDLILELVMDMRENSFDVLSEEEKNQVKIARDNYCKGNVVSFDVIKKRLDEKWGLN